MKIRTFRKLDNDVYRVSIYTEDWSEGDRLLMAKYGEPQIDLGGTFGTSTTFTLDSDLQNVMSDSPFSASFDYRDNVNAEDNAITWATTIAANIAAAVTALRVQDDNFTNETVVGV